MNELDENLFSKKIKKIDDGKRILLALFESGIDKKDFAAMVGYSVSNAARLYKKEFFKNEELTKIVSALELSVTEWYAIGSEIVLPKSMIVEEPIAVYGRSLENENAHLKKIISLQEEIIAGLRLEILALKEKKE